MLELKCVYMRPTPTHPTMLLSPIHYTHTHPQISCADADCAVDDAFAAWRWREEDRVANGASFMRNVRWLTCCIRASPRRVLCQTLVVPLCACMCVCECECVGAIIICVLQAPLTVRSRSCCCLISAPGQTATHSQKTQYESIKNCIQIQ